MLKRGALYLDHIWNMTEVVMMTSCMGVLEITRMQETFMEKTVTHPTTDATLMTTRLSIFVEMFHKRRVHTLNSLMAEMT